MPFKSVKGEMERFEQGALHSGKGGKVVTNPKQAIAIALSEQRRGVGHPGQTATRNRLKQDRADSVRHVKRSTR